MTNLDQLVHRYLEDRDGLAPRELDELIAGLKGDPELAVTLREQIVLDELLAQKLAVDRLNFVAQVEQRIADHERGHDELTQQTADLRSLAAAEGKAQPHGSWKRYALAAGLLVAIGSAIAVVGRLSDHPPAIARVKAVDGEVKIEQNGDSETAEVDGSLESGQQIVVPSGASITLAYDDGSEIRLKGECAVTFGDEQPTAAKRLRIDRGEVVANVKLQTAGAMRFVTPHAVATAQSSLLRLVVTNENTLLDVSEGKAQFERLSDKRMLLVTASESGLASPDTLQIRQLTWPDRRDGLSYLFSPLEKTPMEDKPLTVARNPETRDLRFASFEPRGDASLQESRLYYELNGGYLISPAAGSDIFAANRGGSELTLEAVFSPASMNQEAGGRIVGLADESDEADFALAQDGPDVTFSLKTDTKPATASPRMSINSTETPLHLTVTYRYGELIAYRDGMEIARSKDLLGPLTGWRSGPLTVGADASGERPWRGILEAVALYNRCLEPGEVARNARNYRLLAGRGM